MAKPPDNTGLRRLWNATRWSLQGLAAAWRHEAAFRQEVLATLVLVPLALVLGRGGCERALMVGSWLLVPVAELLNSAIEAAVDRAGDAPHPLAGRAKDLGSAAVFVALVLAGGVWALVLLG
ncbi:MAG: diacylglycerol kinase [Gammaproteobacteria bacterium]|nr:MAG: diacylglycerol kinase [Gammaproteobacteria bacterium]